VSGVCVETVDGGVDDGGVQEVPGPFGTLAIRIGGNETSGSDVPMCVTSAGSDVVITGILNQSADLGGGSLIGTFLVKYNSDGVHVWSKSWGLNIGFADVRADGNGDVLVTGHVEGSANLGCGPITANSHGEFLLAKFDGRNGACKWSIHAGTGDTADGRNIAVAGTDLIVTGNFGGNSGSGTITLGTSLLTSGGLIDIFVGRFEGATGHAVWATSFPGTKNDYVSDIVNVDESSFAIAGFFFGGTLAIGTSTLTGQAFVSRYKSDGSGPIWVQQYSSGGVGDPHGLASLPSGDLALATNFSSSSITFGDFTLQGVGSTMAIVRLDGSNGKAISGTAYGNHTAVTSAGLVSLPNGNLAGVAQFGGTLAFGNTNLNAGAGSALAVFQLTPEGAPMSAKRYGGNEPDFATCARACVSNEIVLTGTYDHAIDFGASAPLSSLGSRTIFAARVSP